MAIVPTTSYVKFIKGTPSAYASLPTKDSNTLYFISEDDSSSGLLYLGDKLIGDGNDGSAGGASALSELTDVVLETVADKQLLTYDAASGKWINAALSTILSVMVGATADSNGVSGLVPTPQKGDEHKFLRGDGTWVTLDIDGDVANGVLDQVETKINELVTKVGQLDPTDLTSRVSTLETSVNTLSNTTIPALDTRVGSLETNFASLSSRIDTVEASVQWATITEDK